MNETDEQSFMRMFKEIGVKFDELDNSDGVNRIAIDVQCPGCEEMTCIVFAFYNGKLNHVV